jgi:hypothetical protein
MKRQNLQRVAGPGLKGADAISAALPAGRRSHHGDHRHLGLIQSADLAVKPAFRVELRIMPGFGRLAVGQHSGALLQAQSWSLIRSAAGIVESLQCAAGHAVMSARIRVCCCWLKTKNLSFFVCDTRNLLDR